MENVAMGNLYQDYVRNAWIEAWHRAQSQYVEARDELMRDLHQRNMATSGQRWTRDIKLHAKYTMQAIHACLDDLDRTAAPLSGPEKTAFWRVVGGLEVVVAQQLQSHVATLEAQARQMGVGGGGLLVATNLELGSNIATMRHLIGIAVQKRLGAVSIAAPKDSVDELAALARSGDAHDLEIVAGEVRAAIEKNQPAVGLDRLHTFATKFVRGLCEKHGLTSARDEPLNSICSKYRKKLHDEGLLESKMTVSILKSMFTPLEHFNAVRNDHSLAHDNRLLNDGEALLIVKHVVNALYFLRDLESRLQQTASARPASESENAPLPEGDTG